MESQSLPDLSGLTVLQVIPTLETGGAERTTLEVAKGVVAAGGKCIVASEGGGMVARLVEEGSRHVTLPVASKNPMVMARAQGLLCHLIEDSGTGIVHARSRAPAWPAMGAARATGAAFVTTYHGIYSGRGRMKRLYNSVMARGDTVIANSAYTAHVVRQTYDGWKFFDPERLVTVPRGADLSSFAPGAVSEERLAAALAKFGGERAFRVLLAGRLTEWKGQRVLIEAARLLQNREGVPALRVALTGDAQGRDAYRKELALMIEQSGLGETVTLPGHWDDMPAAYRWADVAISASTRPEAFGRVAVEAMACSRPVIATDHGGSKETVVDGETGILVPPGDASRLAAAIDKLSCDRDLRVRMGQAGAERAAARFSTGAMVSATLDVYASLTNSKSESGGRTGQ